MQATNVRDWGEALMTSVTGALALFMSAIPRILGFIVIVVVGWFIAGLIAKGLAAILRNIRFNEFAERSGLAKFVAEMGVDTDPSGLIAATVKWFVRLLVLIVGFDALGLPAVSQVLHQLLLWLPNLVVALVVLVIAGLAANALHTVVRGATARAGFTTPDLVANIAWVAVWGFGIIVAVNQIGIAETLVNTLFMGLVGALALALGLAFGLGARDTAGQIVKDWYEGIQQARPKLERAASAARDEVRQTGGRVSPAGSYTRDPARDAAERDPHRR